VLAEAWVAVNAPTDLDRVQAVGLTVAEGRHRLGDGRFEQRIIAAPRALDALRSEGFTVRVARADARRGAPRAGYHSPSEGDALLADLAASDPRSGLAVVGTSVQGRPLTGLWLGQPPEDGAPTWRVLGAHHGDEWSSFEVALDLAQTLAHGDGTDPAITGLLDDATVWVVPYVNPDGVSVGSRYNADDVDLNRNYDYEWSASTFRSGDAPFTEPETRAVRALADYGAPLASLSLHSGDTNIGYVWNYTTDPSPESEQVAAMAAAYKDRCTAPGFWVTDGAAWYVTHGDTNDWSYGRYGGMDFTVEVTGDKTPPGSEIPTFVGWHHDAVLGFLEQPITLQGVVVDARTAQPLSATITLARGDRATVITRTHPVAGTFYRVAASGPVTLTFSAPGYAPASRTVTMGTDGALQAGVALQPLPLGDGAPSPRWIAGRTEVTLPGAPIAGVARLVRPGHATREIPVHDGTIQVDPTGLDPGPWSVVLHDGTAWPRGLFLQDTGVVTLDGVDRTGDTWEVRGSGFQSGSRAWALVGPQRTWTPLPVSSESTTRLVIDPSGVPPAAHADLVILSNGIQVAALDLPPTGTPDTGSLDTSAPLLVKGGCGCTSGDVSGAWSMLPLLFLLIRRRRS